MTENINSGPSINFRTLAPRRDPFDDIEKPKPAPITKYKYLTKKDLGYKPDAFEQAKFEYSPLDKVFNDGLDKSDKNEGLLKRLKNIEDKSNNQLLTIKNISRPAIKGKNNGNVSDEY